MKRYDREILKFAIDILNYADDKILKLIARKINKFLIFTTVIKENYKEWKDLLRSFIWEEEIKDILQLITGSEILSTTNINKVKVAL